MVDLPTLKIPDDYLKEEIRDGFMVSRERKQIWTVELDLYAKLESVCLKYDLRLFSDSGTLLGTVRHNGFIPWDDDMDFVMFRNDYDRLCEVGVSEFEYPYYFQTDENCTELRHGHLQVRNSNTTAILDCDREKGYKHNQGIFIDVFPIDGLPKASERIEYWSELIELNETAKDYYKVGKYEEAKLYFDTFEKTIRKYPPVQGGKAALLSYELNGKKGNRFVDDYKDVIRMPFEFIDMAVPVGYENILRTIYGTWKKPVMQESDHKGVFFDVSHAYTDYI